jgi:hypothetical protein
MHRVLSSAVLAGVLCGAALLTGCADMAWQDARDRDSMWAYQDFIKEYPDAKQVPQARERIDDLTFASAKSTNTEASYAKYLAKYPDGRHGAEARTAMPVRAFDEAKSAGKIESYEAFIGKYPNHELAAKADQQLRAMLLKRTKEAESVAAVEAFLKRYPQGKDSDELRQGLPALREWEPRKKLGQLVIDLAPQHRYSFMEGPQTIKSKTYDEDLRQLQTLLKSGVDPATVNIEGYRPSKSESKMGSLPGGGFTIQQSFDPGSCGTPVPASAGGMTLVNYCKANDMTDVLNVLQGKAASQPASASAPATSPAE